jgi:hypothetical protein
MKKFLIILTITLALCACNTTGRAEKEVFTVNFNSPQIPMGELEIQINAPFPLPGIRKHVATLIYYPEEDAVCLQYVSDLITYYQCWSRKGRAAFINALEEYKNDYDTRNLSTTGRNQTRQKYGVVQGFLMWRMHRFALLARAEVRIDLGYLFVSNAPYFTLYQWDAHYVDRALSDNNRNSSRLPLYFTRSQADELALRFDQSYLLELAANNSNNVFNEKDVGVDQY